MSKSVKTLGLEFHPVTSEGWAALEELFGKRGACGGCWCMWWRLPRSQFVKQKGEVNRTSLKAIVASGEVPGILAFQGKQPIAWCAVAPRECYPTLERSRVLKRVDDKPVWSVVCFFTARAFRRKGVTSQLLEATVSYVGKRGGKIIEGYPVDPKKGRKIADPFVYTGLASSFRKAGFTEVLRRSETRPIMRYTIKTSRDKKLLFP